MPDAASHPRALFDIPSDRAYLATAQVGPFPVSVREAGITGMDRKYHPWTLKHPEDWLADLAVTRSLFAGLIHAEARDIAVCAATSYGVAIANLNLPVPEGSKLIMPADQHLSNVLQWRVRAREAEATAVEVPQPGNASWSDALLAEIDRNTSVVAVPNCDWVTGQLFDLKAIGARCREVGAALVVDAIQSLGVVPLDIRMVQPDFLIAGTFKWLLGPMSMALLYVAPHRQAGKPLEQHGHNRADFGSRKEGDYAHMGEAFAEGAQRYDVGQRANFVLLPMVNAALRIILDWQPEQTLADIEPLGRRVAELGRSLGLGVVPDALTSPHIVGLQAETALMESFETKLARDQVHVSVRGGKIRVAVHRFNTEADIDRLARSLTRLFG